MPAINSWIEAADRIVVATESLFSSKSNLGDIKAVCIDFDACLLAGADKECVERAVEWAHKAESQKKRVIIVGKTGSLAHAHQFRGRNYRFLDRKDLPTNMHRAKGERLAEAVEQALSRYQEQFKKSQEGFKARRIGDRRGPHASLNAGHDQARQESLKHALDTAAAQEMTDEQRKLFVQHMHKE